MPIDDELVRARLENFEQICRDAGIKLTHQRREVFRELARSGEHPDAETVHRGVRERVPSMSLDTVYRTLWMLHDLGLVETMGPLRERARFDANLDRHHHFVCTRCGLTRDVYSDEFDRLTVPDSVAEVGRVVVTHVEVRGLCHACAAAVDHEDNAPEGEEETP